MQLRRPIAFLLLLLGMIALPIRVSAQEKSAADTLGIKRVLVPAGTKIGDLIKTEGTLIEVPLAALEARLERVAQLQASAKQLPRLVKATYRAELSGNNLTNGAGEWAIDHPGASAAILPLASFNLALKQSRLDGREAVLGDLDGANLGLLIEKTGLQTLVFDWSLRGTPGVQGVAFDLRLPPCPLVSIELKLPADQTLVMAKSLGLLTGPHETENPAFKLWRLQVAGRSQIELLARRGNESGRTPRIFTSSETRVQFSPEQTVYETDAQIEVLHAPITELAFEIDPTLQAYEVSSRQTIVRSWNVEPAAPGGKAGQNRSVLRIQLREPLLGVLNGLRLRFIGPRWTDQEAAIPTIEMLGAISRGETLKLHLHPDQHLERWKAGAFRLVTSSTESDGSQAMTLVDTQPDGKGPRPRFLLRTEGVDCTVNQDTRWRLDPSGMTLTSELTYDLSRGQLFALELKIPKNAAWRVASVDLQPREALQKWSIAGGVLRVDLQRGITPRSDCKLTVQLQSERDKTPTNSRSIDFPDLEPLGANLRQGTLAILADPHQQISLVESNVRTSRPDAVLAKDPRLLFFFTYRQTPVQGRIRLAPQRPILQARTQQQITVTPDLARIRATVTVEPIVGQPMHVDLLFSGSGNSPWKIEAKGAEIAGKERLPHGELALFGLRFGATNPYARVASSLLAPRGQIWRVHFREPLTKSVVLVAQQDVPPPENDGVAGMPPLALDWSLPIVVPLDAERIEGEVSLQPLGAVLSNVRSPGFEPAPANGAASNAFARLFRFKRAGLLDAPTLRVNVNRRVNDSTSQAVLDVAELTTSIDAAGNVAHHFRASVWNWQAREFRMVLPAESTIVAARLNGVDLDRVPRSLRDDGLELLVPMSEESRPQSIELVFRTETTPWLATLGLDIAAPLPKLPLAPLVVRRTLRLAPGWLPLRQETVFSLERQAPADDSLRRVWRTGKRVADEFWPSAPPEWIERQRLSFLSDEGMLRRAGAREMSLAEAIARLVFDAKENPPAIVLDRVALRGLDLSPKSKVAFVPESSTPFWESLGLVYVATPKAALLTSKERASQWTRSIREETLTGSLVVEAVAQAVAHGQDASGQFCAADEWLRTENAAESASAETQSSATSASDGTTTWRPIQGESDDGAAYIVVRRTQVRGAAVLLALATGGIGWAASRVFSARVFFRFVWLAASACLLAFFTVPLSLRELALGPIVALGLLLAASYRQLLRRAPAGPAPMRPSRSTQKVIKASLAGCLLAVLSAFGLCRAQEPESRVIFLLNEGGEQSPRALVRPDLLHWLGDQERQSRPVLDDAVFLAANYRGNWDKVAVRFQATFDLFAFKDRVALVVPLAGVDLLEGSSLDGVPIYPVVAPAGKVGYQIVVPDKGPHRLTLSFLAKPLASGDVKITGPVVPSSSLELTTPTKLGSPRLVRGWGAETIRRDVKKGEQTLEAHLGREPMIQIQGLAAGPSGPTAGLHVRELYSWDLRAGSCTALGLLAYAASSEVGQVEIQLPRGLEVRSVELAESAAGRPAGAIKAWRVAPRDDGRVLQIEFLQPLNGSFQVLLGMVPRWPNAAGPIELRLPLPLRTTMTDGMIGVRVDEPDSLEKTQFLGVAAVAPEDFVKEWARLSQRDVGAPLHAYSFARATKNAAAAALEVTPLAAKPRVQSDVTWTAQPQTIDLLAKLNVSAAEDVFLLPISLADTVVLRDVQGADVHHWSRQGNTLHVWLVGPRKKTSVTLVGWIPHGKPKAMQLPAPSVIGAVVESATLTLASAAGFILDPKGTTGLVEEPAENGKRRFRSASGQFPTEFQFRSQTSTPTFQTLTAVEMHGDVCSVATHVHGQIEQGDFPELQIRLSHWPTPAPRLLLSVPGAKVKSVAAGRNHVWTINVPAGTPQQVSFTIKGQASLKSGQTLELPEFHVERGGILAEKVVALVGMQLTGSSPLKTSVVRTATKELAPWPLELARLRAESARYVKWPATEKTLTVQPREAIVAPAAQILSAHHRVVVGEPERWLHRMTWSLWAKSGHDLEIRLPEGASFAAAFLDGQPATPRQIGSASLALSLPPSQKPRTVVLCWTYPQVNESFALPRLASAELIGLEPVAVRGEIGVPSGWAPTDRAWIASESKALLADLQSELRALQILGDELPAAAKAGQGPLAHCVQSFAFLARQAAYHLRINREFPSAVREALETQLKSAIDDEQKLAKRLNLDPSRIAAEKSPWLAAPRPTFPGSETGTPFAWLVRPGEQEPLAILTRTDDAPRHAPLLPFALSVLVLSFWTRGVAIWVRLWPEQLAALAALGLAVGGLSLIGVGLIAIAVLGRSLAIAHGVRRLVRQAWKQPAAL